MTRKIQVEILGDESDLQRAFKKASGSADSFAARLTGGVARAGKLAALGIAALAAGAAAAGKKMVDLASDAAEVDSKLGVVFGKALPGLKKNLDAFADATGASSFKLREQAADMGALLRPLVGTQQAAAGMSSQFVKLATDLGSFNNVPVDEALLAIRSGLVGEAEPLRRFGVLLNEAAVKQEALRLGLVKGNQELTEQQKVQARASLIMKQTTLAQGDATRTAGSMANQMKALRNNITDAATSLGVKLIPFALAAVKAFNDNWPAIEKVAGRVLGAVISGVGAAVETVARVVRDVAPQVQSAFEAIAPYAVDFAEKTRAAFEAVRPVVVGFAKAAADAFVGLVDVVRDVVGWFKQHETATTLLMSVTVGLTAAVVTYAAVTKTVAAVQAVVTAATKAWAAAQLALNVVMAANPFVLAAVAIVALGAALVVAYQRSETFRRIVNEAFEKVKAVVLPIVAALQAAWDRFGDDILKVATTTFNTLKTVVQNALNVIRGVVDVFIGLFTGDWSRAWNGLKAVVSGALGAALAILRGVLSNFLTAARALGGAILDGVAAGLTLLGAKVMEVLGRIPGWLAQAAAAAGAAALGIGRAIVQGIMTGMESLVGSLVDKAKSIAMAPVNAAKGILGIGSPSTVWASLGEDTISGYILGITTKTPELKGKAAEAVQQALDAARAKVEAFQGRLGDAFGNLGEYAARAFRAKTDALLDNIDRKFDAKIAKWQGFADALTPAEKQLRQLDEQEAKRSRASAMAAAQEQLAKAQALDDGVEKERAVADALEAIRQADLANTRAKLEEQATAERAARERRAAEEIAALEAAKARELQNLEERRRQMEEKLGEQLVALQTRLAKHPEEYDKVQKRVLALLRSYGVEMGDAGELLGKAFAGGLRRSEDAVAAAAKRLAKVVDQYLRVKSPTEKGPMSTLDRWWRKVPETLVSGLDTRPLTGALEAIRVPAMPTGTSGIAASVAGTSMSGNVYITVPVTVQGAYVGERQIEDVVTAAVERVGRRNGRNAFNGWATS